MIQRYKIDSVRPVIEQKELEDMKDFDLLMRNYMQKGDKGSDLMDLAKRFMIGVGAVFVLIIAIYQVKGRFQSDAIPIIELEKNETNQTDSKQADSFRIVEDETLLLEVKPDYGPLKKEGLSMDSGSKVKDKRLNETAHESEAEDITNQEGIEYDYLQAEPVNGMSNLYNYFENELKYPESVIADSIQGTLIVFFTVDTNGNIQDIKVEEPLGDLFEAEAIRLINNMPPWKPAMLNNKPISSRLSVPLNFRIEK